MEPHLHLYCLENGLEKAEQEERKRVLWLEVKKKFLEIEVFDTKRVDIEKSEIPLSRKCSSLAVLTV